MTGVRMKALQTFNRLGGRVRRGREFTTSENHAAYLAARGLAERLPQPASTQAVEPEGEPVAPGPTETTAPKHVGGGWYEVNGQRVQGKAAAQALLAGE